MNKFRIEYDIITTWIVDKSSKNHVDININNENLLFIKEFDTETPTIDIIEYMNRIQKWGKLNRREMILIYILIDSLPFKIHVKNIHKVYLVCAALIHKYYDDMINNNNLWARIGGITTKELIQLEFILLDLINYKLNYSKSKYNLYKNKIQTYLYQNIHIMNISFYDRQLEISNDKIHDKNYIRQKIIERSPNTFLICFRNKNDNVVDKNNKSRILCFQSNLLFNLQLLHLMMN